LKEYNSKIKRFEKWDVLNVNSRKYQYAIQKNVKSK